MGGVIIRNASKEDFHAVFKLVNDLEEFNFSEADQNLIYRHNLADPTIVYLVAEFDQKVIGFLSCHIQLLLHHGGKVGEIQELVVDAKHRNNNIGEKLVQKMIKLCPGLDVFQLEVSSNKLREKAHRFYDRQGFSDSHKKFTMMFEGNVLINRKLHD